MIWEIIKELLQNNWEFISSAMLAFIIRLIEKAKNKKRIMQNIETDFPELAVKIKDSMERTA